MTQPVHAVPNSALVVRGSPAALWREVVGRRVGVTLLCVLVGLSALGVLGPRQGTTTVPSHAVAVDYPRVTRPGLDTRLSIDVPAGDARTGFRVSIDHAAWESLGIEQIVPEPTAQRALGARTILEFGAAGAGSQVRFLGRVGTRQPPGRLAWRLRWAPGTRSAGAGESLDLVTWVLP